VTTTLHPLLSGRWSPRGFDQGHDLRDDEIAALLEAARWAPSANNSQPWRFLVGLRGSDAYKGLYDLLAPGNQLWAGAASALILVAATPGAYALYDTGQAVAHLVMQAGELGLSVHQMGGFDRDAAGGLLGDELQPVVVIAVGRHDPAAALTPTLAERERAPRVRRPVEDLLLVG
jgi:nitroreductase